MQLYNIFCAIIIMCEFMRIIIYAKMIFRLISLVIGIKMTVVFSDYENIENSDTVKTVDMLTILVTTVFGGITLNNIEFDLKEGEAKPDGKHLSRRRNRYPDAPINAKTADQLMTAFRAALEGRAHPLTPEAASIRIIASLRRLFGDEMPLEMLVTQDDSKEQYRKISRLMTALELLLAETTNMQSSTKAATCTWIVKTLGTVTSTEGLNHVLIDKS